MDLNRVAEVKSSPTNRTKQSKIPISEQILRQCTTDNKPIFLSVTKKYNSARYESCHINFYTKHSMDFGDFPSVYLFHSFPEAKDEIYKAFLPSSVKEEQEEVWDDEAKYLVTLQEKEENKYNDRVAIQE